MSKSEEADKLWKSGRGYLMRRDDESLWITHSCGGAMDQRPKYFLGNVGEKGRTEAACEMQIHDDELVVLFVAPPPQVIQILRHAYATMRPFSEYLSEIGQSVRTMNEKGVDPRLDRALYDVNRAVKELRMAIEAGAVETVGESEDDAHGRR